MRTRSGLVVLGLAVAALVAVTGCTSTPAPQSSDTAAFADVLTQTIDWHECEAPSTDESVGLAAVGRSAASRQCAIVSMPLDWTDEAATDRVQLALIRYPAPGGTEHGTLFVNPGGPGGSGIDLATRLVVEPRAEPVTSQFDVVGFDPRGIGASTPLKCDADSSDIPETLAFARCLRDNPVAHHMGTSSVARDLDALRHLVGDEKLNYLGYSYGTVLGATYATLFPQNVGRTVLDSATDSTWAEPVSAWDQDRAGLLAAVELGRACAQSNPSPFPCAWTNEDGLRALAVRLAETPWVASDGTEIGDSAFEGYLSVTEYKVNADRALRMRNIAGAAAGDQASIDAIASDHGSSTVKLAGSIVSCFSVSPHPDVIGLYDHALEVTGDSQQAAAALDKVGSQCNLLEEMGTDLTAFDAAGSAPILVIGVTGDHATPYDHAVSLVGELGTARLLTLEAFQHGASYLKKNAACIDAKTTAYLLTGDLPPEGTVCQLDSVP